MEQWYGCSCWGWRTLRPLIFGSPLPDAGCAWRLLAAGVSMDIMSSSLLAIPTATGWLASPAMPANSISQLYSWSSKSLAAAVD